MSKSPWDLTGKVAIITGGGTGIGRATALLFSKHGASVVLASRKMEHLEAVAEEVHAQGGRALPVKTDVRVKAEVEALAQRTMDEFGRIDILINNAGGNRRSRIEETTIEQWDNMQHLNLRGPFLCGQAVGKFMVPQGGGSIVNISSGAGRTEGTGTWGLTPYGSAKAGLIRLTYLMAGEWGKHNIRVNCIAVGAIKTDGFLGNMRRIGQEPDSVAGRNALGRGGWPEEVAYPVLFLASDASSYVTGETFGVNGGPRFD